MKSAALLFAATTLWGQNAIQGPVTGWIWDQQQVALRPVLGIPGSSILGAGLESSVTFSRAVSDQRSYALGIGSEDGQVYLRPFSAAAPQALPDIPKSAARLVLSPSGDSALFYYESALKVALVTGLPNEARLVREIDLSAEGEPALLAVSDGGSSVLLGYPSTRTTLVLDGDGNRWKLNHDGAGESLAFIDHSNDALLTDDGGVWLVRSVNGNPEERQLLEGAAFAGISADRRHVVAASRTGRVQILNLESNETTALECACEPTKLSRMAGGSVFQLNDGADKPIWLVDLNGASPRTVFVPADIKAAE